MELVLGMVVLPGDRTPLQRRTMGLDTAILGDLVRLQRRTMGLDTAILGDLVQVILDFAPT